jgi:FkbM family methyltransferase
MRYLAWNIGRRLVNADFVLPLTDDINIILSNHENYATLAYLERLWDFQEMLFLLHFLRAGDLFVDVGANVGAYSLLASAGAGAQSFAIEPIPATFRKLQRNIRLNAVEGLVQAANIGIGDVTATLQFTATLGGLDHVVRPGDRSATVEVPVSTLDEALRGQSPRKMKLDVEGYEIKVLRGATGILDSPSLQALIVELNGSGEAYDASDQDVHDQLVGRGFRPFAYDAITRKLAELPGYRKDGLNTLYCRPDVTMLARLASGRKFNVSGRSY